MIADLKAMQKTKPKVEQRHGKNKGARQKSELLA